MMVLISYDVSTVSAAGKTRLRKVAKECQNHDIPLHTGKDNDIFPVG